MRKVTAPLEEGGTSVAGSTIRFESRTVIRRPVGVVFDRLADVPGYRRWMHHTGLFRRCELVSEPPVRQGTTYVDATRMGTFHGEVTEFAPPTRLAFSETLSWFGSPVSQARPGYVLEGDESSTVVHHVAEGELFGWMRFLRPVAAFMARVERTRTLKSLKRSLESE
jgi:uncharacterized protein YndB with AHSA1/START domain